MGAGAKLSSRVERRRSTSPRASQRRSDVLAEGTAFVIALTLAASTVACLSSTARSWILYFDGDSMLFALVRASMAVGQPQQWVLPSVLFVPEALIYLPIGAIGLSTRTTLILDAIANWLLYYAAFRLVASRLRVRRSAAIVGSVLAVVAITACAVTETSADRNTLEPASLLATTTYYSGTVLGVIVGCALLAASLGRSRRRTRVRALLFVVVALSTMTNPLFLAWGVVPFAATALLVRAVGLRWREVLTVVALLVGGAEVGMLARIPFAAILTQDPVGKVRPALALDAAGYYGRLLTARLATAPGWIECVLVVALFAVAVVGLAVSIRHRSLVDVVLYGVAVIGPVTVTVGAIALGTFAARYLEPDVFLPPIALLPITARVVPRLRRSLRGTRLTRRIAVGVLAVVTIGAGVASLGVLVGRPWGTAAADVRCVDDWITATGETGAGQYWTVRAPKAYLADPRQLIQTDSALNGYSWIVNANDFTRRRVSFLLSDAESRSYTVPATALPTGTLVCGRYTITEFGAGGIPVGPAHH